MMELPLNKVINGDCLKVMRDWPDASIDLLATDPPYGISFMGKNWDTFNELVNPQGAYAKKKGFTKLPRNKPVAMLEFFVPVWKECFRVLKPGSFMFVMCSARQDTQYKQVLALEQAGFNIGFTPIYWTYASGFPKAMNISKSIDKKLGYIKQLDGSYAGYQPKPAVEIILVVMKPLSEKTYLKQALKNGKGITWLEKCRIPYESEEDKFDKGIQSGLSKEKFFDKDLTHIEKKSNSVGRFPANLIVSDDQLNDGNNRKASPVRFKNVGWKHSGNTKEDMTKLDWQNEFNDSGSFSRYFDLDRWWLERVKNLPEAVRKTFPFLVTPKASKSEKNKGLEIKEDKNPNKHPTVKPLKLMSYLVTLGSRDGDVVLDPFCGSGTTLLACEMLNRRWIGIELSKEYSKIAEARIKPLLKQGHLTTLQEPECK